MKKLNLSSIKKLNDASLEKARMNEIFGGRRAVIGSGDCTLDTITVTPSGTSNDGNDDWDGECSGSLPPER